MSLRLAWLHALARIDADAQIKQTAPLASVLPPLACFGARAEKSRSLASVLGASVTRFLPHGNILVLVVSPNSRSKHPVKALVFAAHQLLKCLRDAGDVTVMRYKACEIENCSEQLRQKLASARAVVLLSNSREIHSGEIGTCLDFAKAACAVFSCGSQFLTGRRPLKFRYNCPVFTFERAVSCAEIEQSWLWYAVAVLVQCGIADTQQELTAHYCRARSQHQADLVCLLADLTPAQADVLADFDVLLKTLSFVENAVCAGLLSGGLPDDNVTTIDDFRRKVSKACIRVNGARFGATLVPPAVLNQRLPLRALVEELRTCLYRRSRFGLEACVSRILTNDLAVHLHQSILWPRSIDLSRSIELRFWRDEFCLPATFDDTDVLALTTALCHGLHRFSREQALHWLRFLALHCSSAHGFRCVCYTLLKLSDHAAVHTRGSAHLDVTGADYRFDRAALKPHGFAIDVWLGASGHAAIMALPRQRGNPTTAAPTGVLTRVQGAETLYFAAGKYAAVRVPSDVAAQCDIAAEFFVEPPRGPPLQPPRTRMADRVLHG